MTAWHRLLRTALRRQGGFSPELETWILRPSCRRACPFVRCRLGGPVIAELEGLLALGPRATGDAEAQASSALDLGPDEYVQASRSTLMQAHDLLERLSSGVEDQTGPFLPSSRGDAGSTVTTAPPGVVCALAEILSLGPGRDQLDYALTDAKRVVAELAKVGLKITAKTKGPNDLASEP